MQVVVAKSERDPRWTARAMQRRKVTRLRACAPVKPQPFAKISVADQREVDRLLGQQTKVTARVRRAFMDAVGKLQDRIDLEQIRSLLEQGRVDQAISAVDTQLVLQGMTPIGQAASAGAIAAAQASALALPELGLGHLNISFGVTNAATIDYLRTYEMGLIRGLTQDALASVRLAVTNGVTAGRNPLDIARDVRAFIGLTPQQTRAVINYRAGLENLDRSVLDRALRDARFDSTVDNAVSQQAPLSQDYIDKLTQRYADRYLKYRSETIARTEALRAVNAGNQLLWRQATDSGKVDSDTVTRQWVYTHDAKTRPAHRAIPGMNPEGVGLNEPFDTPDGPLMFPGDPNGLPQATINCRCSVFFRVRQSRAQPSRPTEDNG